MARPLARAASGRRALALLIAVLLAGECWARALSVSAERTSAFDLEIEGLTVAGGTGGPEFVPWAALRELPTRVLVLDGEFVPGEQQVTVVSLADVWAALPVRPQADAVFAWCSDGYVSVFDRNQVKVLQPFVILEINGRGPETWPPAGLSFNPGPYVISISSKLSAAVDGLLDADHKRPWGVVRLEFVELTAALEPASSGRWAGLSVRAQAGRDLWINSCASCHVGPQGLRGGTKGLRAFEVLATYATERPDSFRRYVRAPQEVEPSAKMPRHAHYSDAQLDALIAFVTAEQE